VRGSDLVRAVRHQRQGRLGARCFALTVFDPAEAGSGKPQREMLVGVRDRLAVGAAEAQVDAEPRQAEAVGLRRERHAAVGVRDLLGVIGKSVAARAVAEEITRNALGAEIAVADEAGEKDSGRRLVASDVSRVSEPIDRSAETAGADQLRQDHTADDGRRQRHRDGRERAAAVTRVGDRRGHRPEPDVGQVEARHQRRARRKAAAHERAAPVAQEVERRVDACVGEDDVGDLADDVAHAIAAERTVRAAANAEHRMADQQQAGPGELGAAVIEVGDAGLQRRVRLARRQRGAASVKAAGDGDGATGSAARPAAFTGAPRPG
jgi:hypothetical protein